MISETSDDRSIEDFALTISLLVRRVRADAPPELREFSWTQKAVLLRLEQAGPTTSAELARAEGVTPQSMGAIVALLEEMDVVARSPHPTDGRQMLVQLTPKFLGLRKRGNEAKETWLSQAFAGLSKKERETVVKAVALMKRMAATK